MENTKLTEQQLQQIKDIQTRYQNAVQEMGNIEISKLELEHRRKEVEEYLADTKQIEQTIAQQIEKEFGKGTINIETGEFKSTE
jgi:proteasome assembly chaperone (PAC2) family protein